MIESPPNRPAPPDTVADADPFAFTPVADGAPGVDPLAFIPVAAAARHDGWTADRQRSFVEALSVMGVVARAARAVGMSATGAYELRARPDAGSFAAAWDLALAMARDRAFALAMDHAINGMEVPRFYRGRQVGTVRRLDFRLAVAALMPPPPAAGAHRGPPR